MRDNERLTLELQKDKRRCTHCTVVGIRKKMQAAKTAI